MIFGAADNNDSDSDCIPTCEQSFQFAVIPPRRSTNRRYESCVRDLKEAGQVRRPARSVKDQDDVQILQDLGKPCCSKRCLRAFSVEDLQSHRKPIVAMQEAERTRWLVMELTTKRREHSPVYSVHGRPVCRTAFLIATGICKFKWKNIVEQADMGGSVSVFLTMQFSFSTLLAFTHFFLFFLPCFCLCLT